MTSSTSSSKQSSLASASRLHPHRIFQPKPTILFRSKGDLDLPIEICLKIIEEVVTADPKVGPWALISVSKDFCTLLRIYERSIVTRASTEEDHGYPAILFPCWPQNRHILIFSHSYDWLCEVRCRSHITESLIHHTVTDMTQGQLALDLPAPDAPESEIFLRTKRFKTNALHLLYGMADSTATSNDIHQTRSLQRAYLESLATTELAILGVFVRVLGIGYFRLTQKNQPNKTNDSIRDRWIVFEDRVLRYGPFFAHATTAIAQTERAIRNWSDEVIVEAVKDMEAFETGQGESYASLQSVLWKLFCARVKCDLFDSWDEARQAVEEVMASYEL